MSKSLTSILSNLNNFQSLEIVDRGYIKHNFKGLQIPNK